MDIEFKDGNIVATKSAVKEIITYLGELYDGTWRQQAQVIVKLSGTVGLGEVTKFLSDHFVKGNQGDPTDELKIENDLIHIPYRFVKGYFSGSVTLRMESEQLSYFMNVLGDIKPLYKEGDAFFGWVIKHPYHYWWYR